MSSRYSSSAQTLTGRPSARYSPAGVASSASGSPSSGSATYKHVDATSVSIESGSAGGAVAGAYGGAAYGRYMPWYWLIWVFVIPLVLFALFMVFPPSWVLECGPNGVQTVSLTRVLGLSVIVGLILVLIFWFIAAWC